MLGGYSASFLDSRGKLVTRSYDILGGVKFFLFLHHIVRTQFPHFFHLVCTGLYSTFVFQKPDPDAIPPIATPDLHDADSAHEEVCFFCLVARYRFFFSVSLENIVGYTLLKQ
jgi:mRNA (guanine-N7-)-methyltransferase